MLHYKLYEYLLIFPKKGCTIVKKTGRILALVLGFCLVLSGCMFRGVDEYFVIPQTSETNRNLQETIKTVMGTATAISPISGSNTQSIQLVDLDGDGIQEAIAFYQDTSSERPLKIGVFKEDDQQEFYLYAEISGTGADIESIEYKNLVTGGGLEIIVSWQVTPSVHTLVAYSVLENQVAELMRSGYTRYLAADLNENGLDEILLLQMDTTTSNNRVEMYTGVEGVMEFHSSASLSEGIGALQSMEAGVLGDQVAGLFVTCEYGENNHITDVFSFGDTGLWNISRNESDRKSTDTQRYYTGASVSDINEDGITEIPLATSIPSYSTVMGAENFWQIDWMQYDSLGRSTHVMSTYHNYSDSWYLELPESMQSGITLHRVEHATIGERAVVFSLWNGDEDMEPVAFLTIYRLTGNNKASHASEDNRFILEVNSETIYAAEFTDIGWDCGVDEEMLLKLFHTM